MTDLRAVSLGRSPLTRKAAIDQCFAFRRQLFSMLAQPDGAHLIVSPNEDRLSCEVVALFNVDRDGTRAWQEMASRLAPEIWQSLSVRRMELGAA